MRISAGIRSGLFGVLFCCLSLTATAELKEREGLVKKVKDGDTVILADGEEIRLLGVDTPEKKRGNKVRAQPLSDDATAALAALVDKRRVKLVFGISRTGHFDRTLAYLHLQDGTDVQLEMLKSGWAMVTAYPPDLSHLKTYRAAELDAQKRNVGIWGEPYFVVHDLDRDAKLPSEYGPIRVAGTVTDVNPIGVAVEITLSERFKIKIYKGHWKEFWHGQDALTWIGKRVVAQGRASAKRKDMTVRHPAMLRVK